MWNEISVSCVTRSRNTNKVLPGASCQLKWVVSIPGPSALLPWTAGAGHPHPGGGVGVTHSAVTPALQGVAQQVLREVPSHLKLDYQR